MGKLFDLEWIDYKTKVEAIPKLEDKLSFLNTSYAEKMNELPNSKDSVQIYNIQQDLIEISDLITYYRSSVDTHQV